MTLILSKTDGLINTRGVLTGSRPVQWEYTGGPDCQGKALSFLLSAIAFEITAILYLTCNYIDTVSTIPTGFSNEVWVHF